MILPYLPAECSTNLTDSGYKGVIAFWRPMDLDDKARWADACTQQGVRTNSAGGAVIGLKLQLLRVEGLRVQEMRDEVLVDVPFTIEEHLTRLPLGFHNKVWAEIELKSSLSEYDAKNSEERSELPVLIVSDPSPAGDAPSSNETPSSAP